MPSPGGEILPLPSGLTKLSTTWAPDPPRGGHTRSTAAFAANSPEQSYLLSKPKNNENADNTKLAMITETTTVACGYLKIEI